MRTRPSWRARYRVINGKHAVELKLRTPHQLFDERDPSPFRERDLDDDAARYIHESFSDLRDQGEAKLSISFETMAEFKERPTEIVEAIHAFYRFELDSKRRQLRKVFRLGSISLLIGIAFLFICTSLGQMLENAGTQPLVPLLREGLAIMGWVAMWRPISVFLYEWWPIIDELNLLRELATVEVDIRSREEALAKEPTKERQETQNRELSTADRSIVGKKSMAV
jgi:hypothetical protein